MQFALCPLVRKRNRPDFQPLRITARGQLRDHADAHPRLDHAAYRLEVTYFDPKAERVAQIVGRLDQKGVDRAPLRQSDIFVLEGIGEVHGFAPGKRMIRTGDEHKAVSAVRQVLQIGRRGLAGHDADVG